MGLDIYKPLHSTVICIFHRLSAFVEFDCRSKEQEEMLKKPEYEPRQELKNWARTSDAEYKNKETEVLHKAQDTWTFWKPLNLHCTPGELFHFSRLKQ